MSTFSSFNTVVHCSPEHLLSHRKGLGIFRDSTSLLGQAALSPPGCTKRHISAGFQSLGTQSKDRSLKGSLRAGTQQYLIGASFFCPTFIYMTKQGVQGKETFS